MGNKFLQKQLHKILYLTSKSKAEFSRKLDISQQSLDKYLMGKSDIQKLSIRLFEFGVNLNWFYSGEGKVFIDSDEIILNENRESSEILIRQKNRINYWIKKHYDSLIDFENQNSITKNDLKEILKEDNVFNYTLIKVLKKSGCNTDWILTGEGSLYSNNEVGKELKRRYEND